MVSRIFLSLFPAYSKLGHCDNNVSVQFKNKVFLIIPSRLVANLHVLCMKPYINSL